MKLTYYKQTKAQSFDYRLICPFVVVGKKTQSLLARTIVNILGITHDATRSSVSNSTTYELFQNCKMLPTISFLQNIRENATFTKEL